MVGKAWHAGRITEAQRRGGKEGETDERKREGEQEVGTGYKTPKPILNDFPQQNSTS